MFSRFTRLLAAALALSLTPALAHAQTLKSFTLSPTTILGGKSVTGKVTLTAVAPTGGFAVNLASNKSFVLPPAMATVPAGATSVTFSVPATPVATTSVASVSATAGTVSLSANLTVTPPALSSIGLSPIIVTGGGSSTGTVKLTGKAPAGGWTVNLSSNQTYATVPATVTVAEGGTSVLFKVLTVAVATDDRRR